MKILDRYILATYLKTFFSVFIILLMIFILQSVWLYIKELAGKDLDIIIIFKFLLYVSPRIIVLVLPLTILLASIMVFGQLAENYEFAAMKSTGISLQRAMKGLSIFILGLSLVTFFFANNVIPAAEFSFYNLRRNIAKVKPSFAIAEGQFNQLGPLINIKVSEKSGDRGEFLKDVVIHQKSNEKEKKNSRLITANTGEFVSSEDSNEVQLILFDGYFYNDIEDNKRNRENKKRAFIKAPFTKNTLNIDLSDLNNVDFDDQNNSITKSSMLSVKALDSVIDTLRIGKKNEYKTLSKSMLERSKLNILDFNINTKNDTLYEGDNILKIFDPRRQIDILNLAINANTTSLKLFETKKKTLLTKESNLNKHIIAYYDKYALAIMCIILFFVGAPLGALIKKGGIGLPIVVAVLIFLTYHFISIFAKNSAEDGSINPIFATWLSTLIMFPLSIYLTYRATKDRSLIDADGLLNPLKKLLVKSSPETPIDTSILEEHSEIYQSLKASENDKLIDIVKNFHLYNEHDNYRNTALNILEIRGISKQELKLKGNLTNETYKNALQLKSNYDDNSKMAFPLYFLFLVPGITGLILNNNQFTTLGKILIGISIFFVILFLITYFKSIKNQFSFRKLKEDKILPTTILGIILGIPFYVIYYIYYKKKMDPFLKVIK